MILGKENGPEGQAENIVIRTPYLWYLLRGGRQSKEKENETEGTDDKAKTEVVSSEEVV